MKVMISSRMTGKGHVALNGTEGNTYSLLLRKPKERDHLEDLEIDGRTILKYILKR